MENLWGKGCYVDFFASTAEDKELNQRLKFARHVINRKANAFSTSEIERGDGYFLIAEYITAMSMYTSSLRYAEIGSENVALAYSKRANCFLRLKMYQEALADIELAQTAGASNDLLPELEQRRRDCETLMNSATETEEQSEIQPTLDYEANKRLPCLANVVDLNYDSKFGRHFVANSDIPTNKVISVEESFAVSHLQDTGRCYTCFRKFRNFIACEKCALVVFCNSECMSKNETHALECGTLFAICAKRKWLPAKLDVQTVLNAISIFGNVEGLMEFVENTLLEDPLQFPTAMDDAISKYHCYFKLMSFGWSNFTEEAKHAYLLAIELPEVRAFFNTHEKQRFLMHLIAHHTAINLANVHSGQNSMVVNIAESLLNHSCDPNVRSFLSRNQMVVETTRLVKKGEQLFISYLTHQELQQNKRFRQQALQRGYGFNCYCSKCESE